MWPQDGVFELEGGRKIRLIEMYRHDIYANLLEGAPPRHMNYRVILHLDRVGKSLMDWGVCGKPSVLLPTLVSRGYRAPWTGLNWYHFRSLPDEPSKEEGRSWPEWMPGTGTVALFRSDAIAGDPEGGDCSHLRLIWFQKEPVELMEPEPLAHLRVIPWDTLATSWIY